MKLKMLEESQFARQKEMEEEEKIEEKVGWNVGPTGERKEEMNVGWNVGLNRRSSKFEIT
jgi:hypothetical protein